MHFLTGVKKCRKNGVPWWEIRNMKILTKNFKISVRFFNSP